MALRTFRSNPSLGGFGGDSTEQLLISDVNLGEISVQGSDGDAFGQIIKELVDNAVDACSQSIGASSRSSDKRVRVEIQKFYGVRQRNGERTSNSDSSGDILRITITDNGCGMKDIEACVDAFHTSKAHEFSENSRSPDQSREGETAGRYGIGLTLCLLHAQRLVPGSCAVIRSATVEATHWATVKCVVDAEKDSIKCIPCPTIVKDADDESGTSVSLLVPGGIGANLAWPRVAEYFARFKLSFDLKCSLDILAPSLSRVPLFIRPLEGINSGKLPLRDNETARNSEEGSWVDGLAYGFDNAEVPSEDEEQGAPSNDDQDRTKVWKAVQVYYGRTFDKSNVSRASVPIQTRKCGRKKNQRRPELEVILIVQGPEEAEEEEENGPGDSGLDEANAQQESNQAASMVLVRMVNHVPLLDSSEAVACGLVRAVAGKKRLWNSFGLDVSLNSDSNLAKLLSFDVKDSEQVAPFFFRGNHAQLEREVYNGENESDSETLGEEYDAVGTKRRRRQKHKRQVLPASVRLGSILLVAHIHAQPTELPLPTLSKGRLPVDNKAIDQAVEVALSRCLRQLQETSPDLLLTTKELKTAERDGVYIPAFSSAMASILVRAKIRLSSDMVLSWYNEQHAENENNALNELDDNSYKNKLSALIELRLKDVLAKGGKKRTEEAGEQDGDSQYETESALHLEPLADILGYDLPRQISPTANSQSHSEQGGDSDISTQTDDFEEW